MAQSMNRATLIGRLGADPEAVGREGQVVKFRLATSESWKDKSTGERQERTQWHQVVIFAEPAGRFVMDYLRKGDLVLVEGTLEYREWQPEGESRAVKFAEVVIRPYSGQVQKLGSPGQASGGDAPDEERPRGGGRRQDSAPSGRRGDLDDEIPF